MNCLIKFVNGNGNDKKYFGLKFKMFVVVIEFGVYEMKYEVKNNRYFFLDEL